VTWQRERRSLIGCLAIMHDPSTTELAGSKSGVRRRLVLTGGGTAGHVMPHIAILPTLREHQWDILYIGSDGIEKQIATKAGIPFKAIWTGKLRRYWSWKNFTDIFRIVGGIFQAVAILARFRPQVVFSKGGFVSVPVSFAAWLLRIPVVSHESDITPGLANRIIARFARFILFAFPETAKYVPKERSLLVGLPIRSELLRGVRSRASQLTGFAEDVRFSHVLVMGGSQGAQPINDALESELPELVKRHQLIHITGKGKGISFSHPNYFAIEFVADELADFLAWSDMVISRAGANSVFEIIAAEKPVVLIPLSKGSRGDQLANANNLEKLGCAVVRLENQLTDNSLLSTLSELEKSRMAMVDAQKKFKEDLATAGDIPSILLNIASNRPL
jgi:UDP-N-acetylglucosamine--N-acetylmuramyl-(pentapeptide) pyrophosphoryl-undecaprenol N-acetylglucosamine transferase